MFPPDWLGRAAVITVHPIRLRLSNAFLAIGQRPVLVDAGSPGEADKIVRAMAGHGVAPRDLSLILLTHAHTDHAGAARQLRERSRAPVALHPADAAMLGRGTMGRLRPVRPRHRLLELYVNRPFDGLTPDVGLADGQRLDAYGLAAAVVHTPGHCAGSVSVVLDGPEGSADRLRGEADESAGRDALVGDLLIGGFLGGLLNRHRPRLPYFADDPAELRRSVARMIARAGGTWYAGHGGPLAASDIPASLFARE
ncbi:MAG: MBL fold metallo-hydrolase [Planctomycetota bacterium]